MEGISIGAIIWRLLEAIGGLIICVFAWLFKDTREEINKVKADVVELRATHEADMQSWGKACAEKHEREFTRSTDYMTKSDGAEIKAEVRAVRADVQAINNNLLAIAQK